MDYLESVRDLKGSALDALARALFERDRNTFNEVLVRLTKDGTMRDYETAAAMLSTLPVAASSSKYSFADAMYGTLEGDGYFNLYLSICAECGVSEQEYMPLLLSAQYAEKGTALNSWDKSVDRFIERIANENFDRAADYVDRFDRKFGKYSVLINVDRERAIKRLVGMALYGKNIDKAAVRDVLMDYGEVSGALMSLYGSASAKERVAIVRLLLTFRNDILVRDFLKDTVEKDKSKSVREAAKAGIKRTKVKNAALYLERLMEESTPLCVSDWAELLSDGQMRDVADKIFFFALGAEGRVRILVYNDGCFLGSNDKPIDANEDQPIYVLHPLDITSEFANILPKDISQPFLQINRPIYHRISGERYYSDRLIGTMIDRTEFNERLKANGFTFCTKRSDDEPNIAVCSLGGYVIGVECILPQSTDSVSCGKLTYYNASDVVKLKRSLYISAADPIDLRFVPRKTFSELTYRAYKLFGCE